MKPEEKSRIIIDKQLLNAGWDIVSREEYIPKATLAVKEALMTGNKESDYLLFVDWFYPQILDQLICLKETYIFKAVKRRMWQSR